MPFVCGEQQDWRFSRNKKLEKLNNKKTKQTKTNRECFGPSGVALRASSPDPRQNKEGKQKTNLTKKGGFRAKWPFGPPYLTLKPSKKTETKNKMTNTKKGTFQLSIKIFCVLGCFIQKTFWQLGPKKTHPQKHSKNWGFSNPPPKKNLMITKRPVLDKKPKPEIPVIFCFL